MSHRVCRFVSVADQYYSISIANVSNAINDVLASEAFHTAHRSQRLARGQKQAYFHTIALMLVPVESAGSKGRQKTVQHLTLIV